MKFLFFLAACCFALYLFLASGSDQVQAEGRKIVAYAEQRVNEIPQ